METAHKRHCWISFPQQENASLEYLFLVTICFYSEQSLTSYYVSIFYNKNSSVEMDNNTPIPAPSPCSVLQGKRGIKMTDAPATGAGGDGLIEASGVAFWKSLLWNPPPEKVGGRMKGD